MCVIGVTVVIQFEENRIRQQEVEVRALIAIMNITKNIYLYEKCQTKLFNVAFPEELAKKINQETLEIK